MLEKYFFIFSEIFLLKFFFRLILNGECGDICFIVLIFCSVLVHFIFLSLFYFWFEKLIFNIFIKRTKINKEDFYFLLKLIFSFLYIQIIKEILFSSLQIEFLPYIIFYFFSTILVLYLFFFYIFIKQFLSFFFKNFYLRVEKKYFFFNCEYFLYFLIIFFLVFGYLYLLLGFFLNEIDPDFPSLLHFNFFTVL